MQKEYNVLILETLYFELRHSEDLPTLKSMDTGDMLFSRVPFQGHRTGDQGRLLCAHRDIVYKMTVAKQVIDVHTNLFFQILVDRYLRMDIIDGHIGMCRALYRQKRDRMLEAMDRHMSGLAAWNVPDGGLFIWAELSEGYDGLELCRRLKERSISCVPGNTFCIDVNQVSRGFRLNFSLPSDEQIDRGIAVIGRVLSEYIK